MKRWLPLATLLLVGCAAPQGPAAPSSPGAGAEAPPWQLDWARGAVFYEIFVRSFADSDGDGIGDLRGLTARLDYLNDGDPETDGDLGVEGIWLMPIFESPSYHGYDTVDYYRVDRDYGTEEDLRVLLREAHARGIRVIVDLMINHTSAQHPWFVESAESAESPRRDWYVWRSSDPGWTQPWGGSNPTWHEKNGFYYYGLFWGGMPDLNLRNPAVRTEVEHIAEHWLEFGLDGLRLDAARHLIEVGDGAGQSDSEETLAFWKEFTGSVRSIRPGALPVGEVWSDTPTIARYYRAGLPMCFDFPLATAILETVRFQDAEPLDSTLEQIRDQYPARALDGTFLTNHDMKRLASELDDEPGPMRSAAALLLTLPGTPFLYYGEEVGLLNGPGDADEYKRTPMPWNDTDGGGFTDGKQWFAFAPGRATANVAAQGSDPGSLLSWYRELIHLRATSPALRDGDLEFVESPRKVDSVVVFLRRSPGPDPETVLVAHNLSGTAVEVSPLPLAAASLEPMLSSAGVPPPLRGAAGWNVQLPPYSTGVWRFGS